MNFKNFWESKWAYRLLAFLLAVGLFAYVHAENINNTRQDAHSDNAITATTKRTLKVPLQLNADTDKYFITGYPENVSVTVEGAASLVTVTANTQNFRIIADLSKLSVGKHTVKLKESGLNKELSYRIKPATITVNIQDRKTRRMPIQVKYNRDSLAPGYTVGTQKLNTETAEITGAKGEINRVYQVVANVVMKRNTKETVSQEVILQALDEDGNTVNVVVNPETVHVTLPISLPSKRVPVSLKATGTAAAGKTVSLSTQTSEVTIYGSQSVLDNIDRLTIPVAIDGITTSTTKSIATTAGNAKLTAASPDTLKVAIKVSDNTTQTPNAPAAASSSAKADSTSASSESTSSSESASSQSADSNSND
ncbi:YbbR-like domain-containing protein [Lacticaseibacillus baoqingensis]|uniref:YbbR-like domain-containing protein n=1 Tax=Lacticaseibacillus baoqingensis TaxID=2486013 RepID=A0ABW4E3K3_9LACO|nr:CdaR family protein [Lacticaseibacillus baoqingensis]